MFAGGSEHGMDGWHNKAQYFPTGDERDFVYTVDVQHFWL